MNRVEQRQRWAEAQVTGSVTLDVAAADASFRSYYRLREYPYVLMDAPPDREPLGPFLDVAKRLHEAGVRAPRVLANDSEQGFVLLEDLGDTLFADRLNPNSVSKLYPLALVPLATFAEMPFEGLPDYDDALLCSEMDLFLDWFVVRQLKRDTAECHLWWPQLRSLLLEAAAEQPRVFVHRDFHCGNLMLVDGQAAVIDFQDAVAGPLCYDAASLLWDRYAAWPEDVIGSWSERIRRLIAPQISPATWRRWLDLIGLQRNLKVVGIFARLSLRDGKHGYRDWQPRFFRYALEIAARYPECSALANYLRELPYESEA